jgi:hypothetical protein
MRLRSGRTTRSSLAPGNADPKGCLYEGGAIETKLRWGSLKRTKGRLAASVKAHWSVRPERKGKPARAKAGRDSPQVLEHPDVPRRVDERHHKTVARDPEIAEHIRNARIGE